MALIQALRRSIKGDKEKQNHVSIGNKSAVAIIPPKKVIRALYDYEAQSSQELSFSKGDFFHVIGRENDQDWYEACNPALPDARGLVPVAFFQALGRTERDSAQSDNGRPPTAKSPDHDSGYSENAPHPITAAAPITHRSTKSTDIDNKIFATVMYDFEAQRPDELGATKNEQIIIIAQSTPEWFVAKPIARLGGPGLIPVSFVEIRYVRTKEVVPNAVEAVKRAGVPSVEEWKRMAANYKNSSITLGKFEAGAGAGVQQAVEQGMERLSLQAGRPSTQNGSQHHAAQQSASQPQQYAPDHEQFELPAPTKAWIPRYCFAEDKYWFVIVAVLQDGRYWELSRYYEDFYDFQIALLTQFPAEAGNGGSKRTLPYMPGPVSYVTDAITEGRLHNLDAYVKNLLGQPQYISHCNLVKRFFAPREGDYEVDATYVEEELRLSEGSQQPPESPGNGGPRTNLNENSYPGPSAASRQLSNSQQGTGPQPQGQQKPPSVMKVKMYYQGEYKNLLVPPEVDYQQLCGRVRDRFNLSADNQLQLFYKDDSSGKKLSLTNNNDLDFALQRREKLVLFVEVL
ncbi:MAP kinase activator [Metarhizium album ARSEF 1941]|uniref:MAP kinase activator n=1 Tax=Metarhizium album (strain ARSEF 1941) TaxID=1081103 RepID=A0A0B2WVS5_METAS|nr:MAP kinase activator [Metarhizium album ARSEF 1941]KHN97010.1 MAP kinase activator [Metarhizium album ARSEF 1941]